VSFATAATAASAPAAAGGSAVAAAGDDGDALLITTELGDASDDDRVVSINNIGVVTVADAALVTTIGALVDGGVGAGVGGGVGAGGVVVVVVVTSLGDCCCCMSRPNNEHVRMWIVSRRIGARLPSSGCSLCAPVSQDRSLSAETNTEIKTKHDYLQLCHLHHLLCHSCSLETSTTSERPIGEVTLMNRCSIQDMCHHHTCRLSCACQ
jgi:hypothetical protein